MKIQLKTQHRRLAPRIMALLVLAAMPAQGDEPDSQAGRSTRATSPAVVATSEGAGASEKVSAQRLAQHPLQPVLELARAGYERIIGEVQDYTCELVKRERVDGQLLPQEIIFAKVRHERGDRDPAAESPVSLYLRFQAPTHLANREILFVKTGQDDKLLVRNGGKRLAFLTLELPPTCALAMQGNRYPVTEFGIQRLVERMIELGEQELPYGECEVDIESNVLVEDMTCTKIEVCHPVRRDHFMYHLARVYIDDSTQLPVRFEAYDWPNPGSGEPVLKEEYTYRNLKLNVGLSDTDFDRTNPDYSFHTSSRAQDK